MYYVSNIIKSSILEIGSGSGEHEVVFQKRFPEVIWQTSNTMLIHSKIINSWIEHENLSKKMPQPLVLDVEKISWEIPLKLLDSLQGIVFINMFDVAELNCTVLLFKESGKIQKKGLFLMLYGSFRIGKKHIKK